MTGVVKIRLSLVIKFALTKPPSSKWSRSQYSKLGLLTANPRSGPFLFLFDTH